MESRAARDQQYLAAMEDITQVMRRSMDKYHEENKESEFHPQRTRYAQMEAMVASERRLLEEVSLPCRLILEHFSTFSDQPDRSISVRYGSALYCNGTYQGYAINEWGHVTLKLGSFSITWRDDEYQYMFYSDKVILRPLDIQKPEISFSFSFSLKYSKLLEEFSDVAGHPQTGYYQPDLFSKED